MTTPRYEQMFGVVCGFQRSDPRTVYTGRGSWPNPRKGSDMTTVPVPVKTCCEHRADGGRR